MRLPLLLISFGFYCLPVFAIHHEIHGFARFNELKYPPDFTHFDWVNPHAPKGGQVRLMAIGTFDTLNPYTFKGTSPSATGDFLQYGIHELNAPLMVGTGIYDPSGDEASSAYGLIAQSLEYNETLSWVVFNLRSEACFHDGHPITAEDVAFSFHTLIEQGDPRFRIDFKGVQRVEILSPHRVRFVFQQPNNPQLILQLGELPVLPQHYWKNRDFTATTFEIPLGSGPYRITEIQPGQRLVFERLAHWWGAELPVNRGKYNFDRVEIQFFREANVAFEAFKAGAFDIFIEHQAKNWANSYHFPAIQQGEIRTAEIPHQIPSPTQALFMNTRRALFQLRSVRQALGMMFDFEWSNRALFHHAYRRSESYYPNSSFSATGKPTGLERQLLDRYQQQLPKRLFNKTFRLPKTEGHGIPRTSLREALHLLADAGWTLTDQGLKDRQGHVFQFELLLVNPRLERVLQPYVENLAQLGIQVQLRTVDRAQYKQRLDQYDFDMIMATLPQSLNPGQEQWLYFHSNQVDIKGGRNYAGIRNPVVDALLEALLAAQSRSEQIGAAKALDRVLLWNHYSIPNWFIDRHRLAYRTRFTHPITPPYTLGLRAWWLTPSETTQ